MTDFRWLWILTCLSATQVNWACSAYSVVSTFMGENLLLNCSLTGNITWTDSTAVNNFTCSSPCQYQLYNITCIDAGIYGCSNGTVDGEMYKVSVFPPIYPVNCEAESRIRSRYIFVVDGENMTLSCSITSSNPSWQLSWRQDGTNVSLIADVTNELNVSLEGAPELHGMNYTCSAEPPVNDTCNWDDVQCVVGPVLVVDEQNFLLSDPYRAGASGNDLALNCSTNLPNTFVRWQVTGGFNYSVLTDNDTFIIMEISTPISEQISGRVWCQLYAGSLSADPTEAIANRSVMIPVEPELTTLLSELTSQQTDQGVTGSTAGATSSGTSVAVTDGTVSVGTISQSAFPESEQPTDGLPTSLGSEKPTVGTASINTTTEASGDPKNIKLGAIIGGVVGGVVFIIIVIAIVLVLLRRPANDVEQNIKRRSKKKQNVNGSKKHRSAILSLRHKLPLFSRPYESDEDDGNDSEHAKTNNDVDTLIMDIQPRSHIASQIRVDLQIDDGGQGTVENGFVPSELGAQTNTGGYEEGRLGIMSHGTFSATDSNDPNLAETSHDITKETNVDDDYSQVEKRNKPGDTAFGNVIYGSFTDPDKDESEYDRMDDDLKGNQDGFNDEQEKDLKSDDGQGEEVAENNVVQDAALPPPPPPLADTDKVVPEMPAPGSEAIDNVENGDT